MSKFQKEIDAFMQKVKAKNPGESEYNQAVHEVAESVNPFMEDQPEYKSSKIIERIS